MGESLPLHNRKHVLISTCKSLDNHSNRNLVNVPATQFKININNTYFLIL